jgi:hypothetical protein
MRIGMIIGLFFLVGCAAVNLSKNPDYSFRPTSAENVAVYNEMQPVKPYVIIGKISAVPDNVISQESLYRELKEYAASIGGEGIIIGDEKQKIKSGYDGELVVRNTVKAFVIRFSEEKKYSSGDMILNP